MTAKTIQSSRQPKSSISMGRLILSLSAIALGSSCTQSASFRLTPATDTLVAGDVTTQEVVERSGAPVDILWVIDNSGSMSSSQEKLRKGLSGFANRFLRAGTDIQMGVITTDAYVASDLWSKFLSTPVTGGTRTPRELQGARGTRPAWGSESAKLQTLIRTKSASSLPSLIAQFEREVVVGTQGMPEERGLNSVLQFLSDNESRSDFVNRLFRKGSQRVIVFLSDENDQSIEPSREGPEPRKLLFQGSSYVGTDVVEANRLLPMQLTIECPSTVVQGVTFEPTSICTRPELQLPVAQFKSELESFFRRLDGMNGSANVMVASIVGKDAATIKALRDKSRADQEERARRGNYRATIEISHDEGKRYLELADLMKRESSADTIGSGSFAMDIGAQDYTPILEKIGLEVERRSTVREYRVRDSFRLTRAPQSGELLVVTILISEGGSRVLQPSQFSVDGTVLKLTDSALLSSLKPGDRIQIRYQPSTVQ